MAEFCVDCWNEMNETNKPSKKVVLSKEPDLCEGCGEWKRIVERERGLWAALRRVYNRLESKAELYRQRHR